MSLSVVTLSQAFAAKGVTGFTNVVNLVEALKGVLQDYEEHSKIATPAKRALQIIKTHYKDAFVATHKVTGAPIRQLDFPSFELLLTILFFWNRHGCCKDTHS